MLCLMQYQAAISVYWLVHFATSDSAFLRVQTFKNV